MGKYKKKVAVVQFKVLLDKKDENLAVAEDMIIESIKNGAELICLPEAFATGLLFSSIKRNSEDENGEIVTKIKNISMKYGVHIIGGFIEKDGKDIFDTAFITGPDGNIIGKYHRCTLWKDEVNYYTQGKPGEIIETDFGNVGLLLGYDLRYPFACHNYFLNKVSLIVCLSLNFAKYGFPIGSMCRTRAADNVCYFVFASGIGPHPFVNSNYMGNSLIIDGSIEDIKLPETTDILAKAGIGSEIIYSELNLKKMKKYQELPSTLFYHDYANCWEKYIKMSN